MNRSLLLSLCLISLMLLLPSFNTDVQALGYEYFVSPDGTSSNTCTRSDPCDPATAIGLASDGDIVYFEGGIYYGTTNPILSVTKGISLHGGWDGTSTSPIIPNPEAYPTTFDGESERSAIIINYSNDAYPILISGFNFINGHINPGFGGAIFVVNGNVLIEGNHFSENYAKSYGGAINIESTYDVIVRDNTFDDNSVDSGGGAIAVSLSLTGNPQITIERNEFFRGSAEYGTAIHVSSASTIITRNKFIDNPGDYAVSFSSSTGAPYSTISNNFFIRSQTALRFIGLTAESHNIWNNTIVDCSIGIDGYVANLNIINNIITGTTTSINHSVGTITGTNNLFYSNISNPHELDNPLNEDESPSFVDSVTDDYHLSKYSPAIDAGATVALTVDFEGDKRPSGAGFDIGADEVMSDYFIFLPLILK